MAKFKVWVLLCVILLTSACSKKQEQHAPWPASVKFSGLTESEKKAITDSLQNFTQTLGSNVFSFDDSPAQFQIVITKLSKSSESSSKAGLATYDDSLCKVELNDLVFSEIWTAYLEPVLWHELGHCSGMEHDPKEGELMYRFASPKDFYSNSAIARFMKSFGDLISLNLK